MKHRLAAMSLAVSLSACSAGPRYIPASTPEPSQPAVTAPVRAPQVMQATGLDGVIGQSAARLLARFGAARIDLAEGDARKLQFTGESCVLDIYLYPLSPGSDPVATHVEARQRRGGEDVDRARCIAEIDR